MTNRKAFARKKYFETIWEFASPIMIMVVQIWSSIVGVKGLNRRYWELVAWTSFVLWVRFLLMLRIKKHISSSITMIFNSFKKMGPYIIIVVIGVLCFSNVFTAIRQSVYQRKQATRPYDKDLHVKNFSDFKDKWAGEWFDLLSEIFVGAVIGLELENSEGFTDSQMLVFLVALIFNTIVLMNLLLAVVGSV